MSLGFGPRRSSMRMHKVIESLVAQASEVGILIICTTLEWRTLEEECKDHGAEREGLIFIG